MTTHDPNRLESKPTTEQPPVEQLHPATAAAAYAAVIVIVHDILIGHKRTLVINLSCFEHPLRLKNFSLLFFMVRYGLDKS